jgi:hypothetical protein
VQPFPPLEKGEQQPESSREEGRVILVGEQCGLFGGELEVASPT